MNIIQTVVFLTPLFLIVPLAFFCAWVESHNRYKKGDEGYLERYTKSLESKAVQVVAYYLVVSYFFTFLIYLFVAFQFEYQMGLVGLTSTCIILTFIVHVLSWDSIAFEVADNSVAFTQNNLSQATEDGFTVLSEHNAGFRMKLPWEEEVATESLGRDIVIPFTGIKFETLDSEIGLEQSVFTIRVDRKFIQNFIRLGNNPEEREIVVSKRFKALIAQKLGDYIATKRSDKLEFVGGNTNEGIIVGSSEYWKMHREELSDYINGILGNKRDYPIQIEQDLGVIAEGMTIGDIVFNEEVSRSRVTKTVMANISDPVKKLVAMGVTPDSAFLACMAVGTEGDDFKAFGILGLGPELMSAAKKILKTIPGGNTAKTAGAKKAPAKKKTPAK